MATGTEPLVVIKYFTASLFSLFGTGAWFWSWKRNKDAADTKRDDKINELSNRLEKHSNTHLTEHEVKDVIKESVTPLKEEIDELKEIGNKTQKTVADLVTEVRVMNAVNKALEQREKEKSHDIS